jgi:hypothetical protein
VLAIGKSGQDHTAVVDHFYNEIKELETGFQCYYTSDNNIRHVAFSLFSWPSREAEHFEHFRRRNLWLQEDNRESSSVETVGTFLVCHLFCVSCGSEQRSFVLPVHIGIVQSLHSDILTLLESALFPTFGLHFYILHVVSRYMIISLLAHNLNIKQFDQYNWQHFAWLSSFSIPAINQPVSHGFILVYCCFVGYEASMLRNNCA